MNQVTRQESIQRTIGSIKACCHYTTLLVPLHKAESIQERLQLTFSLPDKQPCPCSRPVIYGERDEEKRPGSLPAPSTISSMKKPNDTYESRVHPSSTISSMKKPNDTYESRVHPSSGKVTISVEVCLKPSSTVRYDEIKSAVQRMLDKRSLTYEDGPVAFSQADEPFLFEHVESIIISDADEQTTGNGVLLFWQVTLQIHVYQLNEEGPGEELEGTDTIPSFHEWVLPAKEFHGLWESLIFDSTLKQQLVRYAATALLFSEKGVNSHLISWNRVVLLHGPPGTGKTSLCKALAQQLSIRFKNRYKSAALVEVNAHSLFSKWFSESGKLVTKLFQRIEEFVEDGSTLVFVLIDEVESLAAARQTALSGSEPSDSIRVVNALLTQLDRLKYQPNVVVLTTSNITAAIDLAFVDRADIKAYVGFPALHARYEIFRSCVKELQRTGIVSTKVHALQGSGDVGTVGELFTYKSLCSKMSENTEDPRILLSVHISKSLLSVAESCEGFSGRALRKIPFLAYASVGPLQECDYYFFLDAMRETIKKEVSERALL